MIIKMDEQTEGKGYVKPEVDMTADLIGPFFSPEIEIDYLPHMQLLSGNDLGRYFSQRTINAENDYRDFSESSLKLVLTEYNVFMSQFSSDISPLKEHFTTDDVNTLNSIQFVGGPVAHISADERGFVAASPEVLVNLRVTIEDVVKVYFPYIAPRRKELDALMADISYKPRAETGQATGVKLSFPLSKATGVPLAASGKDQHKGPFYLSLSVILGNSIRAMTRLKAIRGQLPEQDQVMSALRALAFNTDPDETCRLANYAHDLMKSAWGQVRSDIWFTRQLSEPITIIGSRYQSAGGLQKRFLLRTNAGFYKTRGLQCRVRNINAPGKIVSSVTRPFSKLISSLVVGTDVHPSTPISLDKMKEHIRKSEKLLNVSQVFATDGSAFDLRHGGPYAAIFAACCIRILTEVGMSPSNITCFIYSNWYETWLPSFLAFGQQARLVDTAALLPSGASTTTLNNMFCGRFDNLAIVVGYCMDVLKMNSAQARSLITTFADSSVDYLNQTVLGSFGDDFLLLLSKKIDPSGFKSYIASFSEMTKLKYEQEVPNKFLSQYYFPLKKFCSSDQILDGHYRENVELSSARLGKSLSNIVLPERPKVAAVTAIALTTNIKNFLYKSLAGKSQLIYEVFLKVKKTSLFHRFHLARTIKSLMDGQSPDSFDMDRRFLEEGAKEIELLEHLVLKNQGKEMKFKSSLKGDPWFVSLSVLQQMPADLISCQVLAQKIMDNPLDYGVSADVDELLAIIANLTKGSSDASELEQLGHPELANLVSELSLDMSETDSLTEAFTLARQRITAGKAGELNGNVLSDVDSANVLEIARQVKVGLIYPGSEDFKHLYGDAFAVENTAVIKVIDSVEPITKAIRTITKGCHDICNKGTDSWIASGLNFSQSSELTGGFNTTDNLIKTINLYLDQLLGVLVSEGAAIKIEAKDGLYSIGKIIT